MICVGCGEEIKGEERRNLQSGSSMHVVPLWKEIVNEVLEEEANLDQLLCGSEYTGRMHRKCFTLFERVSRLRSELKEKVKKGIIAIVPPNVRISASLTPTAGEKRPASTDIQMLPKQKQARPPLYAPVPEKSPNVSVQVGYQKKPRTYVLTPSRKHLGKAVARGSRFAIADECLSQPTIRKYLMKKVGILLRADLKAMCSNGADSILHSQKIPDLHSFSWVQLIRELEENAPTLLNVMQSMTYTCKPRENREAVIGMCTAILLKFRCKQMCLIQKLVSLILYAGHCGKQVYIRLQRLNLTLSHRAVVTLVSDLGADFDHKVRRWQEALTNSLITCQSQSKGIEEPEAEKPREPLSESDESDTESDVHSDVTAPAYSPVTTDEEALSSASETEIDNESESIDTPTIAPTNEVVHASSSVITPQSFSFKLVGDNIDKGVKPRFIRAEKFANRSLHYFHSFAVLNRVDFSHLSDAVPDNAHIDTFEMASSLLPSREDDKALRELFIIHVSRVLATHMEFFKFSFDGIIQWHLKHKYNEEMARKSTVVPLGVLFKNENKGEDMVDIMTHHHKYVPAVEYVRQVKIPNSPVRVDVQQALMHKVLFGGDQLTAVRARSAKKAKSNSASPLTRLEGLVPCAEDWHAKLNLLEVIWKYYYTQDSSAEHGTLYQLRNVLHRTNVVNKPSHDFNACDDFLHLVTTSQILYAALNTLSMSSLSDGPQTIPEPQNVWQLDDATRQQVLHSLCEKIVNSYIPFQFHNIQDTSSDNVCNYFKHLLGLGCFYMEYSDAIKEGDGERILRCWRYLLVIFKNAGRKNYSIEALNMLCQSQYKLSPRLSAELLWSRFVNIHGLSGRNIPADLYMEHLNRLLKEAIRVLGVNKSNSSIQRVANALGEICPVLDQFDKENKVAECSHTRKIPAFEKDVKVILQELEKANTISHSSTIRSHHSFPRPKSALTVIDSTKFFDWMVQHM